MAKRDETETAPLGRPDARAIRVLLVDDHAMFRHGVKSILKEGFGDSIEVGEAEDADGALQELGRGQWDLAILDISMPGRSGLQALQEIRKSPGHTRVLVLSMHPENHYAIRALKAGASGFLAKLNAPSELLAAVRQILEGGTYCSASVREALTRQFDRSQGAGLDLLTPREFEVLRLLAAGKSGKEVAAELRISVQTASTHRGHLIRKLGFRNLAELLRYAIEQQLV
jgi:two-component system, NarL family, invasion response regulator UvrY